MYQPPNIPPVPQRVIVDNSAASRAAESFHRMIRRWYRALRATLEEGQDLILEYHTPSGELIVVNQVAHVRDTDMLIFQGYGERGGELCQVLVSAPGFHTMYRIVALPDEKAERRPPIGFVVQNPPREQDE